MKNIDAIVATELVNNIDNIKEENTMKKFSVSLIIGNIAYTKEYDKPTAFGIYKFMVWHNEAAIITDGNGFFLSNFAELPEYKRVYGAPADACLVRYEEKFLSDEDRLRLEAEDAELIEMSRQKHRAAQRKLKNRRGICAMHHYRSFFKEFDRPLDPNRVAVVSDKYVTVQFAEINAFKGMGTIRKEISKETAFSMSSFCIKAVVFPSDFNAACEKLGANKLVDVWGNEHDIEDLDVILSASCFKMWKKYASWDEYVKHFNKRNDKFYVCYVEHDKRRMPLNYQRGQNLQGDVNDAKLFAYKTERFLHAYKYHYYELPMPAIMKPVVTFCDGLKYHWYVKSVLQDCYTSRRNEALGGKVFDIGYSSFNAPDMVAFWQHALGLEVEGILHAGQCMSTLAMGRAMDVTRNCRPNDAHILLFNAKSKLKGYEAFFMGPTVYLNLYDLTTLHLCADDGDRIFWSQDQDLINLVRKSASPIGHRPTDCDVPGGSKTKIRDSFLDMYTDFVDKNVPKELETESFFRTTFNVNKLLNDPLCEVIPGLLGTGRYSYGACKSEDEGLFVSIALRAAEDREEIKDSDNKEALVKALNSVRYAEAYLELEEFATQNGRTMIDVYDNVTRWLFGTANIQNKTWLAKALYDLYFGIFGDMADRIVEFRWRYM